MPAPPPAMRLVAAEAGFLPCGPDVDLADIVVVCYVLVMRGGLYLSTASAGDSF